MIRVIATITGFLHLRHVKIYLTPVHQTGENWPAFSYLDQVGANMNLPIIITIIVAIVGCVGFGVHHHLDAKAQKLSKGSEEERRLAGELRDISSQIDQGRYLYH